MRTGPARSAPILRANHGSPWRRQAWALAWGIITPREEYLSSGEYKRKRRALRLAVIGDIPRELDCDGVVEGTVISARGRVRVDAQLVHAPKDHHLWAESYESDMSDMLLLERQIAEAIARQVHGIAVAGGGARKAKGPGLVAPGDAFFQRSVGGVPQRHTTEAAPARR